MDGFERRGQPGALRWLVATNLEARGVLAAFTERTGGRSAPPFDSLNLALHVADDPAAVRANRSTLRRTLGLAPLATAEQVHGSAVADVDAPERPPEAYREPGPEPPPERACDALITARVGIPLAILTADCVPLALTDGERVAAVHAGWRGTAAGVVASAVRRFDEPARISAAVGPAIRACHYEVGPEVIDALRRGLGIEPVAETRDGRWFLDLSRTVAEHLHRLGVRDVAHSGRCTACEPERFFSYRRDGRTGRQALVTVRT